MIEEARRVEIADVEALDGGGLVMHCRVGNRVVWVPSLGMLPGTEIKRQGDRGGSYFLTTSPSTSVSPRTGRSAADHAPTRPRLRLRVVARVSAPDNDHDDDQHLDPAVRGHRGAP
jgi:hypothetical protein